MIFKYQSYKDFINEHFSQMPKGGRGQYKKLADYLGVSTVVVSQTLKGDRELSSENAFKTTQFLKLTDLETQYFMKLVDLQRAGHHGLKQLYLEDLKRLRKLHKEVRSKYREYAELNDEDKFQFYSDRFYSSVRMGSSLPELNTVSDFAAYFNLPEEKIEEIVSFLLRTKLCVQNEGRLQMGPQHTFVPTHSPYIKNHHRNWRLYSIAKVDNFEPESELMYTAPISLSREAYAQLKTNLLRVIEESMALITPSPEEMIACLNIDLLKI